MSKTLKTSPAGIAKWIHVLKPNTRFNEDGVFNVDLALEGEEAVKFQAEIDSLTDEIVAATKAREKDAKKRKLLDAYTLNRIYAPELDEEGAETGRTIFKFTNKAVARPKGKPPINFKIDIFDAKKNPMKGVDVGRGSLVKVAYEPFGYSNPATKAIGVSCRLKAVQVLDLKTFGGDGAAAFGEEEGYVSEAADESPFGAEPVSAGSGGTGSGDY